VPLGLAPAYERDGQLLGVLLLPAAAVRELAVQGPQFGSVISSITGFPRARNASKVSISPWRFGSSSSGAASPSGTARDSEPPPLSQ
jgi:hypothetical protein